MSTGSPKQTTDVASCSGMLHEVFLAALSGTLVPVASVVNTPVDGLPSSAAAAMAAIGLNLTDEQGLTGRGTWATGDATFPFLTLFQTVYVTPYRDERRWEATIASHWYLHDHLDAPDGEGADYAAPVRCDDSLGLYSSFDLACEVARAHLKGFQTTDAKARGPLDAKAHLRWRAVQAKPENAT